MLKSCLSEWGAVWAVVRVFRVWQTVSRVCLTKCMARTANLTVVDNSDIHVCMPVSEYRRTCGKPDRVFFRNCKVWLWFECCIISYLRTRWTCVHMLADASGRDGLYSSSMSKTTGLGLFWGVQISSIVKTSLVILLGRRFSLKHRRNKTPLPFPLQDAISNLCILTWELIKCRALASWFLWYTWRHLSVSTPPVSVFFSPAERLYWLVTVLRG